MLATLIDEPFDRHGWLFELKWDGFRAIAEIDHGKVKLYSRNQESFVTRFSSIVKELGGLDVQAVLDGEIVAVDAEGISRFQLLQNYQKTGRGTLRYYVFDLLWLNGRDLRDRPLKERKLKLRSILAPRSSAQRRGGGSVRFSEHVETHGKAYFRAAAEVGMEGIIAKDASSIYLEGKRSRAWLKIKAHQSQEAVIAGYTRPQGLRQYFGALVLGVYEGDELVYIGHTGGGFNQALLREIYQKLQPLKRERSPFRPAPKTNTPVQWVEPTLVCQVRFQEWTSDGRMRHPIFLCLRTDKPARRVTRERPRRVSEELIKKGQRPAARRKAT
jgi:bifunctional non-homologous end joining protein LigD